MRPFAAMFLGCCVLFSSPARGDTTFPYKAVVTIEDVYVRSGPGQSYYPTDKLKRGQEVEVYRHDPGGWCAIRPVEGSFTWVSGRHLKLTDDNLAVVTEDGVSARVGSRFSRLRGVVQVRLQKGEVVEVLEAPHDAGRDEEAWFKIAPPSGEFRWVSAKYLDAEDSRDYRDVEPSPPAGEPSHARAARRRSLLPREFQAELEQIELELSAMVIEEPADWSFGELRERTNWLLDEAQTAVERGRARLLANRIARFDDIRERQEAVLAMRDQPDHNSRFLARLRPRDADGEKPTPLFETDGRFDGVGRLTEVVSRKPGAPRYALSNAEGEVLCYVTPTPGVNLHNYVGRQVGVVGTRGYMPEQHAGHIMARHVTPLEGTMLR